MFLLVNGFCFGWLCCIERINGDERLFFECYDDVVSLGGGIW